MDLFDWKPSYPQAPGVKSADDTTLSAAAAIENKAATLRAAVLRMLQLGHYTADEVADLLNESILSIRPRLSELRAMGLILATPARRANRSGHKAIVWTVSRET